MRKLLAALAALFAVNALANDFYTPSGVPSTGAPLVSSTIRNEFASIGTGFNKLPTLTGNGNAFVLINPGGTGMNVIGPLTNGQLFIGNTGSAPTANTITGTASVLTVTNGAGSITLNLATNPAIPGLVANTMVYAGTAAALTSTAAPTSGQILIGSTGAAPALGTVAGTGNQITSTAGAGSITLSLPSAVTMPGSLSVTTTLGVTGATTLSSALTYGGVALNNAVTGTGNMVLSASPTLTGTLTAATATFSGVVTHSSTSTLSGALTYGGVTLSNAVTGTGNMVLSASPTLTGTLTAAIANFSGAVATGALTVTGAASTTTTMTVGTSLIVSGTGPHAIGGATNGDIQLLITGAISGSTNIYGTRIASTLTAPANGSAALLDLEGGTINKAGSGTHADFAAAILSAPAIGAGAATLTNATTLKITGAPSVGTNQRALWVAAGLSELGGAVTTGGVLTVGGGAGWASYNAIVLSGATTSGARMQGNNTSGNFSVGVEDSTGGAMFGGTTAYAAVFGTSVAKSLQLATNNSVRLTIDSAGIFTTGSKYTTAAIGTGNYTVDFANGPYQSITNGAAFTITAPSVDGGCQLLVTNNATAGAITFTGFTVNANTGEALTTTNTNKFIISIMRVNGTSTYQIKALQ